MLKESPPPHYVDDILVRGATREEHDSNVRRVLKALRVHGFRVNPLKVKL